MSDKREHFDRTFSQYRGVMFTYKGIEYYMHMNNPVKHCAIDKKNARGDWEQDFYKFDTLDIMLNAKIFQERSFLELLENDLFEEYEF